MSIERTPKGFRLGVHIADVSHYVRPGSSTDEDARARGTSLYLPGLTVPMLPERLSNDLCSLMPDVNRLTLSAVMDIENGRVVDHRLVKSVIHSHARLTYQAVNRLYEGGETEIAPRYARRCLRCWSSPTACAPAGRPRAPSTWTSTSRNSYWTKTASPPTYCWSAGARPSA